MQYIKIPKLNLVKIDTMQIFRLEIDLNDESGLTFNALVDAPAHNKRLIAFNDKLKQELFFDDNKQMVTGVAISANQLIRRFDRNMGEYYVFFPADQIEKMVLKMSRQKLLSSVNLMHDDKKIVNGITFLEGYFVTDKRRPDVDDQNVQNGSYVMTYYVEDKNLYNELKNGKYIGYSVEGFFNEIQVNHKTNNKMKKENKLMALIFGKQKFEEAKTTDGATVSWEGELAAGTAIFIMAEDGTQIAAPEGELVLEDGRTLSVDGDGLLKEVKEVEAAAEESLEALTGGEIVEALTEMKKQFEKSQKDLNAKIEKLSKNFEGFEKSQVNKNEKFERTDEPYWKTAKIK